MKKLTAEEKKLLKELNSEIKILRIKLAQAEKLEGKDDYISVKLKKNQARFEKVRRKNAEDKAIGKFYMEIEITAKQGDVFVPVSIASGKKTAGFMYIIEGTAAGSIANANLKIRGEGVSQVTIGTLLYAKIPAGKTCAFQVRATINGKFGKVYKIIFNRLNYKLNLTEARYHQYLKEIKSKSVKFG
ncbi:hypothetical protein H6789_02720 [Candidatus Nomurabacteria bacterium]|nr:hypothetical protein [Candidatus Kaiserbacteria bacterium]MCB9815369.1 hypothetical protein [Candidatus Nomurabacteria bacterium]MCB9819590.1 hypothetical protein [Candidatus Nomurabacteria bacterium]